MINLFESKYVSVYENAYNALIARFEEIPECGYNSNEKGVINTLINSMYYKDNLVSILVSETYPDILSITFFPENISLFIRSRELVGGKYFIEIEEAKKLIKNVLYDGTST